MWAANTDFIPTFLDATGVQRPAHIKFDGVSFLPSLHIKRHGHIDTNESMGLGHRNRKHREGRQHVSNGTVLTSPRRILQLHTDNNHTTSENKTNSGIIRIELEINSENNLNSDANISLPRIKDRVFLWHKNTEKTGFDDRIQSAAQMDNLKVITTEMKGEVVFR